MPDISSLATAIDGFARYFSGLESADVWRGIKFDWQPPMQAIENAFDNPHTDSPGWKIGGSALDREVMRPALAQWLDDNGVIELSSKDMGRGYRGWTGANFAARLKGTKEMQVVSLAAEGGEGRNLDLPWNPLVLRPHVWTVFIHAQDGVDYQLAINRAPKINMIDPGQPPGFDQFMNEHIFCGTPWHVERPIDLNSVPGGSVIYSGADAVGYANLEWAQRHAQEQWDPDYQQAIMRRLHENTEHARALYEQSGKPWPRMLRWVDEKSPGEFVTRQAQYLQDGLGRPMQARQIIHLEGGEARRVDRSYKFEPKPHRL